MEDAELPVYADLLGSMQGSEKSRVAARSRTTFSRTTGHDDHIFEMKERLERRRLTD